MGIRDIARRLWRDPLSQSQQFVSKEVHDIGAIRLRLSAIDEQIAEQQRALAAVSVDEVLADSDPGDAIVAKLTALRARRDVLLAAETAALAAEEQRQADEAARQKRSRERAARQKIGEMSRHAAAAAEAAGALQEHYARLCEAGNAVELLLSPEHRLWFSGPLRPNRLRALVQAEQYRAAMRSPFQLVPRRDAPAVGAIEVIETSFIPPLSEVLGTELAAIRAALAPKPAPEPAVEAGSVTSPQPDQASQSDAAARPAGEPA